MRLVLASKPTAKSFERWRDATATSSLQEGRGRHDFYQRVVALRRGEDPRQAFDRVRSRLFRYDVFPPALMAYSMERTDEVTVGAVIVQSVRVVVARVEFAVRVVETWDRRGRDGADAGFTYVTLQGHPERGRETFRLVLRPDRTLLFTIEAWSMPGTWLTALARPFGRLVQVTATKAAMRRVTEE